MIALDAVLVAWLIRSYTLRDDDHGLKGVNTAKGAFIYSTVVCGLMFLGQIILFAVVMASGYYVEE